MAGIALIAILGAFAVLIAVRLAPALLGLKTFSGVDILGTLTPWDDRWLTIPAHNPLVGDTIDNLLPDYTEIYRRLWSGDIPWWSSLSGSGAALLSAPNIPTLTPSAVWMLLAPTWWAIGVAKLVQLAMALGGMMLWLRRLGTTWAAGALAGLLYCTSGFFVAWSGWLSQATVAATIPMLFWAVERFLAVRTARSALLISAAVAWLLLGGFPAVAGHAIYAGALYFVVRCLVERRRFGARDTAVTLVGGAAAVALGVGLSAIQLLPFASSLAQTNIDYRANQFDAVQPFRSMLSVFFPRIFNPQGAFPQGFGPTTNPIEAYAYLGMGAVALALLALLAGRRHGVARGAVPVLAVVGLLAAALVWRHGFWTDWLRNVPVFADNNSGRLREMVALTGCALAGVGFNLLFRPGLPRAVRIRLVGGAWLIVALAAVGCVEVWRRYSPVVSDRLLLIDAALGLASLVLLAIAFTLAQGRSSVAPAVDALASAALASAATGSGGDVRTAPAPETVDPAHPANPQRPTLVAGPAEPPDPGAAAPPPDAQPAVPGPERVTPGPERVTPARAAADGPTARRRTLLAVTIVAFAAVTGVAALSSTDFFWPLSNVADFYPESPGTAAARSATGTGRALLGDGVFLGSSGAANDLRTVTGHSFQAPTWRDLLLTLDPNAYTPPGRTPTNPRVSFKMDNGSLTNPLLDRMAVTSVVTSPAYTVPGPLLALNGAPRTTDVLGGVPMTVGSTEVPGGSLTPRDLRGFVVRVAAPAGDGVRGIGLNAVVRDGAGKELARGSVIRPRWGPGWVQIPVAAESLGRLPGPMTVGISVDARDVPGQTLELTSVGGRVQTIVIGSRSDGLREAYADGAITVWQRPTALPRIRWASSSIVVENPRARIATLADPATPDSAVVLSSPGPRPSGAAARLSTVVDSGDRVAVDVRADGDGYLVLADAIQPGWSVTIDGQPASLVDADHAFGAVFVPQGSHLVEFRFAGKGLRTGAIVTAVSLIIVLLVLLVPLLIRRRRRSADKADNAGASDRTG